MRRHSKNTAPGGRLFPGTVLHRLLLSMMVLCLSFTPVFAGDERFDYDPLGRLIRVIDEDGRVTAYTYDPAGNLLQVIAGGADQTPPVVSSVNPDFVRAGTSREFRFTGTGLLGATVSSADAGLTAAVIAARATELTVRVTAAIDVPPGPRGITVSNAAGSIEAAISLRPALTVSTVPSHIVIPPDSVARPLAIRMSDTEPEPVTLTLTVSDPALVSISPASVVLESGQTEAQLVITGRQTGQAFLNVSSPALLQASKSLIIVNNDALARSVPLGVFVQTSPFENINDLVSPDLGVFVQQSSFQNVNDLVGADVGVFVQTSSSFDNIDNLVSPDLKEREGA